MKDKMDTIFLQIIGRTTYVVRVKSVESAKKRLEDIIRDVLSEEAIREKTEN